MFYDNFINMCAVRGISPSVAAEEIGFDRSAVTGWKKGAKPKDTTIRKIANYFGVSPEELTGSIGPAQIKVTRGEVLETGGLSSEALRVALAFDRADQRAKDMVRLALEPFGLSAASEEAM